MALDRKKEVSHFGTEPPKVEFKYLGVWFTREGKMECEIDRQPVSVHCGDSPVNLGSNPLIWSWTLGHLEDLGVERRCRWSMSFKMKSLSWRSFSQHDLSSACAHLRRTTIYLPAHAFIYFFLRIQIILHDSIQHDLLGWNSLTIHRTSLVHEHRQSSTRLSPYDHDYTCYLGQVSLAKEILELPGYIHITKQIMYIPPLVSLWIIVNRLEIILIVTNATQINLNGMKSSCGLF